MQLTRMDDRGGARMMAIYQLIGLVYLLTIYPIIASIAFIGALIFMVVDVLLKLIRGDGLSSSSFLKEWGMRLLMYPIDQLIYVVGGEGDFPFLP